MATLTKRDVADELYKAGLGFSHADTERAVDLMLDAIVAAVARGDRVEFRGLGVFAAAERGALKGRNPKTGEIVDIPPRRFFKLRPSGKLTPRLNPAQPQQGPAPRADRGGSEREEREDESVRSYTRFRRKHGDDPGSSAPRIPRNR